MFFITTDARHSVAIADMGNYQEVLRQMSPLREVDPGQNRVHMFGNPFKLAKDQVQYSCKSKKTGCYIVHHNCDHNFDSVLSIFLKSLSFERKGTEYTLQH